MKDRYIVYNDDYDLKNNDNFDYHETDINKPLNMIIMMRICTISFLCMKPSSLMLKGTATYMALHFGKQLRALINHLTDSKGHYLQY